MAIPGEQGDGKNEARHLLAADEWAARFAEMLAHLRSSTEHLPPHHFVDDTRETIYAGRGE